MSATQHDVLAEAAAIIDGELIRLRRRRAFGCTVAMLLLAVSASLLMVGLSQRTPIPYVVGIIAFGLALVVARETPDASGARPNRIESR